jgi:hypothetical protein
LTLLPASDCGLQAMDTACDLLSEANPPLQQQALAAGLSAIAADDCIEPAEWEAFRAFAAAMHIPVPSHWGLGRISA